VNIFINGRNSMHGRRTWKVIIILAFGSIDFTLSAQDVFKKANSKLTLGTQIMKLKRGPLVILWLLAEE
jgi:hypothetical protein